MKRYQIQYNIGKAKYVVSFHNGVTKHQDGSAFFQVRIFKNKRALNAFIKELRANGYTN